MADLEEKIKEYEASLAKLKEFDAFADPLSDRSIQEEIAHIELKVHELKKSIYPELTPWERVQISRNQNRPKSLDYIKNICDSFEELHGDRLFRDDEAIVGGFAFIGSRKFVLIAQEKGSDTDSRLKRNFGMSHPEGYRKALRLMEMAEKFNLPVVTLIDTTGACCTLSAEERGQGWAIATNLMKMARLKTPIICALIGEGCSGGAIGIGVGDVIGMLEHAYYSVISPEACASILWKDVKKNGEAAAILRMQAEDMLEFGIVDEVIQEPLGGAHNDPQVMYRSVKEFILNAHAILKDKPVEVLLHDRYERFRKFGVFVTEQEASELLI